MDVNDASGAEALGEGGNEPTLQLGGGHGPKVFIGGSRMLHQDRRSHQNTALAMKTS